MHLTLNMKHCLPGEHDLRLHHTKSVLMSLSVCMGSFYNTSLRKDNQTALTVLHHTHIHECRERAMLKGGNSSRYGLKRQFRHLLLNPGTSAIQHRKPKLFSKREQQLCKRFICILSQHKSFKLQEQ